MARVPTVVVKNKKGHVMRINVADFDSKVHTAIEAAEGAGRGPKKGIEQQIDAAGTFKALESIAKAHNLEWPGDIKPLKAAKAHLLSQLT
jgi:hypothetical protein